MSHLFNLNSYLRFDLRFFISFLILKFWIYNFVIIWNVDVFFFLFLRILQKSVLFYWSIFLVWRIDWRRVFQNILKRIFTTKVIWERNTEECQLLNPVPVIVRIWKKIYIDSWEFGMSVKRRINICTNCFNWLFLCLPQI